MLISLGTSNSPVRKRDSKEVIPLSRTRERVRVRAAPAPRLRNELFDRLNLGHDNRTARLLSQKTHLVA